MIKSDAPYQRFALLLQSVSVELIVESRISVFVSRPDVDLCGQWAGQSNSSDNDDYVKYTWLQRFTAGKSELFFNFFLVFVCAFGIRVGRAAW